MDGEDRAEPVRDATRLSDMGGRQLPAPDTARPALSLLQRILLITDGTVTHILEAYAGELMRVTKLSQDLGPLPRPDPNLDVATGHEVLRRRILLRGQRSGETFLYAESVIVPDRLPQAVRTGLLDTDKPIGRLLSENRMETFREILAVGQEAAADLAAHFGVSPDTVLYFRDYVIATGGLPVMRITEKFPATSFSGIELVAQERSGAPQTPG